MYSMWCGRRSQHTVHRWTLTGGGCTSFCGLYLHEGHKGHEFRLTCDGTSREEAN